MHPALEPYVFKRGSLCVHNRTVLAAMTNKQSHDNGVLSDDEIAWLEARSEVDLASSPPLQPMLKKTDRVGRANLERGLMSTSKASPDWQPPFTITAVLDLLNSFTVECEHPSD